MKNFGLLLVIFAISSCSNQAVKPQKSIQGNALAITSGDETSLGGPNFYVFPVKEVPKATRTIASFDPGVEISNKNLYLYTLLVQHNTFKKSLDFKKEVKVCPQFHNDLVSDKSSLKLSKNVVDLKRSFTNLSEENVAYYPELALTVNDTPLYSYGDKSVISNKFHSALMRKAEVNYNEIQELCEKGTSNGFFVFMNFVKHVQQHPNYLNNEEAYKAVFKIPAVANMLILKGGKSSSSFNDYHPVETEILSRLKANWFKGYINKINNYRMKKVSFRND